MFRRMVTDFSLAAVNAEAWVDLGVDQNDLIIVAITLCIIFAVSVWNEKGISVRTALKAKPAWLRWLVWYALILYIIVFGAYGFGYAPVDPLYAQF